MADYAVTLVGAMSYNIRGPVTGKRYTFVKGRRTKVHPADYPYFEALPRMFEMQGPGSKDRKGRKTVPLSHTTYRRELSRGQAVSQLERLNEFRQRKRAENARNRQMELQARKELAEKEAEKELEELRERNRLLRERAAQVQAAKQAAEQVVAKTKPVEKKTSDEATVEPKPKKRGRPRKKDSEKTTKPKKRGRPRKESTEVD